MDTEPLNAFPSFQLRPTGTGAHDVVAPDGRTVGEVLVLSNGGHRARVGSDTGPQRHSAQRAGDDAVMFHIAAHGLPDQPPAPYSDATEARGAIRLIPRQRQELIDTSARVFFFYALRQPHVAAILSGLAMVDRESDAVTSRTGCQHIARLIPLAQEPAQALLEESTGDARGWLALPLARLLTFCLQARVRLEATATQPPTDLCGRYTARDGADRAMDTLHRIWRDLQSAHSAAHELAAIDAAMTALPGDRYARSALNCRSSAAQLNAVRTAAEETAARVTWSGQTKQGVLVRELSFLAAETSARLEATALVLEDAWRLGNVRAINDDLAHARLGMPTETGEQSVRVGSTELGPVRRTADGYWTGPGIAEPFHSPEGAAAALVRDHIARAAAQCPGTP
ncbi:hypothetical protein [Streptomyces mirabilis]|uniref:hypothetical protein n=1 Tax=Streptomyces mirabilis TaxID=68239 RepID=UPI0021BF47BC|nr:hypothetical protein [Streptomyces mirabilis]MCT9105305.1 hypothetical protein [Streptomyces mirabilis]